MKNPKELKTELLALDNWIEERIQKEVSFEAERTFIFRNLVDVDRTLQNVKGNKITYPKKVWEGTAETATPGSNYSFRSPTLGDYVTVEVGYHRDGVKIPDAWEMWTVPSAIDTEVRNLGHNLATLEDNLIADTVLGATKVPDEVIGTAQGTDVATYELDNAKVLEVTKLWTIKGAASADVTGYNVDYLRGKIECAAAAGSGAVIHAAYRYSTRSNVFEVGTAKQLSVADFITFQAKMKAANRIPDWAVAHPSAEAKLVNSLNTIFVSAALYKPAITGEIGKLGGVPVYVTTALPSGVMVAGVKDAVRYALQKDITVEKEKDPNSDSTLIKGYFYSGAGVVWDDGIAILVNFADNAKKME